MGRRLFDFCFDLGGLISEMGKGLSFGVGGLASKVMDRGMVQIGVMCCFAEFSCSMVFCNGVEEMEIMDGFSEVMGCVRFYSSFPLSYFDTRHGRILKTQGSKLPRVIGYKKQCFENTVCNPSLLLHYYK